MKRTRKIAIFLAAILTAVLLAGCTNSTPPSSQSIPDSEAPQSAPSEIPISSAPEEAEPDVGSESTAEPPSSTSEMEQELPPDSPDVLIAVGETITTSTREITIQGVDFSYRVEPEEKPSSYTYYTPGEGNVYIDVRVQVSNLARKALHGDRVMEVHADYGGHAVYSGFAVTEDSTVGFADAADTAIGEQESRELHYLIECPQDVEENAAASLFVAINIFGVSSEYRLVIR